MKRALVLSGGGAKGCWQAGAILRLHELGNRYDGYFGVSVGAINAAHMAQFPAGTEIDGALQMKEKWHQFSNKDIWRHHNRFFKWFMVPWRHSVYDSTPLKDYLKVYLDPERIITSGKHFAVGAVDLTTGQYVLRDLNDPDIRGAVYDSASYPVMFDPGRSPEGHYMSDGGLVHVTPLGAAIRWGATHIDVITLDPPGMSTWMPPKRAWWHPKIQDVIFRTFDVILQNIIEKDLFDCERINKYVTAGRGDPAHRFIDLRIFRPTSTIPVNSLDFDPKVMAVGFQLGYEEIGRRLVG